VDEAVAALEGIELAEIRMERMRLTRRDVKRMFALPCRIVATCRPDGLTDPERAGILAWAIDCGAAYVDLEIESTPAFRSPLVAAAKERGTRVIVSYHNYGFTPSSAVLEEVVDDCFRKGADIAKVACMVNTGADAARILALLDSPRPVIALGMGARGAVTRVAAPLLGSPFTYAPQRKGKETAPGQLPRGVLQKMLDRLAPR